jgi:redox-regulated HSP33 family molecular chaperone
MATRQLKQGIISVVEMLIADLAYAYLKFSEQIECAISWRLNNSSGTLRPSLKQ